MASNSPTPLNEPQDSPQPDVTPQSHTSQALTTLIGSRVSPQNLQVFGSETVEAMRQQGSHRQRPKRSLNWAQMSIRTKTTILAIALGTLPLVIIGGISTYLTNQTLETKVFKAQRDNSTALTVSINLFLLERYENLNVLATLPIFTKPEFLALTNRKEQQSVLDDFLTEYKLYDNIVYYDLQGNPLVITTGGKTGNRFNEPYFQEVLKTGKAVISQPEVSPSDKSSVIYLAAPVRNRTNQEIIGVMRTRFATSKFEPLIQPFTAGGEELHLVDNQGKIFYATDKKETGDLLSQKVSTLVDAIKNRQLFQIRDLDRDDQIRNVWTTAPLATIEGLPNGLNWSLVTQLDESIAFAASRQLLLTLLLGTGVAVAGVAALAAVLSARALRPLIAASEGVQRIGLGDFNTRLEVTGSDELSGLSDNINKMTGQIQALLGQQEAEARRATTLATIARSTRETEIKEPVSKLMQELRQTLGCDRVLLYRLQETGFGNVLAEDAAPGQPSLLGQQGLPMFSEDQLRAYRNGQTTLMSQITRPEPVQEAADLFSQPLSPEQIQYFQQWGVKGLLMVPVTANNGLYGMVIAHQGDCRDWTALEIDSVTQLSGQLGLGLSGLLSLQQEQSRAALERGQKESLQRELLGLLSEVEGASSGDLTVRAQISDGEIGIVADFFNAIVENLRDIVTQVKETSAQVNASVSANDLSVRKLATDATEQSFQVTETLRSVEEMAVSLQDIAEKATMAARSSQRAARTAQIGGQAMEKTVASISQVREAVAETAKKVKRLGESSQQISKVIELINQIALKTNLLAVNAGIEAARAGEEGRGFAVVAEEVGALAAQSAQATKEIEQIVEAIQKETSQVVEAMEASTSQVVDGTRYVEEAKVSLGQIMQVSNQVNQVFQSISTATGNQVQTSVLVKQLMERVATISRQTSISSQEVSESLQATVTMTHELQSSVGAFKVDN
jgi:methyl-accepting chemotaxis protein PixJ